MKKFFKYFFTVYFFLVTGITPLEISLGATSTGSVQVSATVASSCSVTATALAFGNYTLVQLDATSTITATCTNGTTYTVGLNAGTFAGATTTTRKMSGPSSNSLNYFLYSDSTRTTNWEILRALGFQQPVPEWLKS